jgi:hypothetical protein
VPRRRNHGNASAYLHCRAGKCQDCDCQQRCDWDRDQCLGCLHKHPACSRCRAANTAKSQRQRNGQADPDATGVTTAEVHRKVRQEVQTSVTSRGADRSGQQEHARERKEASARPGRPERAAESYLAFAARALAPAATAQPQRSGRQPIALPASAPRTAIGRPGKSESHVIQDCKEGYHPWEMTDSETGMAKCSRSPECGAVRIDTWIRERESGSGLRYRYVNTRSPTDPAMSTSPSMRPDKPVYLRSSVTGKLCWCPRGVCSDTPGTRCPHR